jgi:methionyl-tRNA formyltransferase
METKENSKSNKMKLLMCGCHVGGVPIIEELLELGYKFEYFVCLTPQQKDQYEISGYYDFREIAQKNEIPVYIPEKYSLNGEKDKLFFEENNFDILIQGGWQRLFPEYLINKLSIGALGFHGSSDFLPKGRGRSPMNWSILENKDRFIMSLFLIKPGVDDGDIVDFIEFDINEFDDINTMYYKYAISNRDLIVRNLPKLLSGEFNVIPQVGEPSYYGKRTPEDGKIDWEEMDVKAIYNLVRSSTKPYPGAFCTVNKTKLRIWKC